MHFWRFLLWCAVNQEIVHFDRRTGAPVRNQTCNLLITSLELQTQSYPAEHNSTGQSWYAELSHQSWAALILMPRSLLIPSGTVWLAVCSGQHNLIGRFSGWHNLIGCLLICTDRMAQSDWLFAQDGTIWLAVSSLAQTGGRSLLFLFYFCSFPDTQTSVKTKVKGETLSLQIHKN